jgi:hypothetical protein
MATPRPALRAAVADLDGPFTVLDLDAALANAGDLVRRAAGTPVRLASKSVRIRPLIERLLAVEGIKRRPVLPPGRGPVAGRRGHLRRHPRRLPVRGPGTARPAGRIGDPYRAAVTLMVDSPASTSTYIDGVLGADHPELRVCLDVDASLDLGPLHLGARRSPVHTPAQAAAVAREITGRPGFRLVGIMAYEGQIAGTTDSSPAVTAMKRISARELAGRRGRVVAAVEEVAGPLEFVNGGGTGSVESTAAEAAVTEIGAGLRGASAPASSTTTTPSRPQPAEWFVLPVVRRARRRHRHRRRRRTHRLRGARGRPRAGGGLPAGARPSPRPREPVRCRPRCAERGRPRPGHSATRCGSVTPRPASSSSGSTEVTRRLPRPRDGTTHGHRTVADVPRRTEELRMTVRPATWHNWSGAQTAHPVRPFVSPATVAEVQATITARRGAVVCT